MPRRARRPATPRTRSARTLRGAPKLPKAPANPAAPPWKRMPAIFRRRFPIAPIGEWQTWWALVTVYHFVPPIDLYTGRRNPQPGFLYQTPLLIPGLNRTGTERSDFWCLPDSPAAVAPPYSRGIVINPISPFTHPDILKDKRERGLLAQYGYLEIFADAKALDDNPTYVIGRAIRGDDVSSRRG
jgi:hypothetical protein